MSKYKRMTERDEWGNADIIGVDSGNLQGNLMGDEFNRVTLALNRLADLEDKIDSGMMIELPCKVGDTLYKICPQGSHIKYGDMWDGKIVQKPCQRCPWNGCRCFDIGYQKDMKEHIVQGREMKNLESIIQILPYIGSIWFTDKSQAEARLKELRGEQ